MGITIIEIRLPGMPPIECLSTIRPFPQSIDAEKSARAFARSTVSSLASVFETETKKSAIFKPNKILVWGQQTFNHVKTYIKINDTKIISSDLDFVYDICSPERVFNPFDIKDIYQQLKLILEINNNL